MATGDGKNAAVRWLRGTVVAHPRVQLHFTPGLLFLDQPGRAVVR